MFYLQKILLALSSPLFLALSLAIFSALKRKWWIAYVATIILTLLSLPITSNQFTKFTEDDNQYFRSVNSDERQAVVVLSGYLSIVSTPVGQKFQWGDATDRFFNGVELANNDKSSYLVFTNERLPWFINAPDTGHFLTTQAQKLGIPSNRILITEPVQNTQQEDLAVAKLGNERGFNRVILVTSAFHIQRAKQIFEGAGLVVNPYPTDYRASSHSLNVLDFIPCASCLANSEFAIREMIGRIYYRLVRYLSKSNPLGTAAI